MSDDEHTQMIAVPDSLLEMDDSAYFESSAAPEVGAQSIGDTHFGSTAFGDPEPLANEPRSNALDPDATPIVPADPELLRQLLPVHQKTCDTPDAVKEQPATASASTPLRGSESRPPGAARWFHSPVLKVAAAVAVGVTAAALMANAFLPKKTTASNAGEPQPGAGETSPAAPASQPTNRLQSKLSPTSAPQPKLSPTSAPATSTTPTRDKLPGATEPKETGSLSANLTENLKELLSGDCEKGASGYALLVKNEPDSVLLQELSAAAVSYCENQTPSPTAGAKR